MVVYMKKIFLVLLSAFYSCNLLFAQFSIGKSPSQLMIERSIIDGLYIVAQDYQLYDSTTGEKYGRNNHKQFNTVYSLGIGVEGRLITNERVSDPSKYDNLYEKYKLKYTATNSDLLVRHWNDSTFRMINIKDKLPAAKYFSNNQNISAEAGWLIIVSSSNSSRNNKVKITTYAKNIICDKDTLIDVSEWGADNVLGGFYMIPSYIKPGEIKFHIVSYLKEKHEDKWLLAQLKENNNEEEVKNDNRNNSTMDNSEDILTPVSSAKDKKKSTKIKKK